MYGVSRAILVIGLGVLLACGSGLPELQPGLLDSPTETGVHGRFTEKTYKASNGPRTIHYKVLEVDGAPVRIPEGFVERTSYAEELDAVAFTVRGPETAAGVFVLQLDGERRIQERLCGYGKLGRWKGSLFVPGACETRWDAGAQARREP